MKKNSVFFIVEGLQMKPLTDSDDVLESDEFLIHVQTLMNLHTFSFIACNNDTIFQLKCALEKLADCSNHEMKLLIGPDYPYPLTDHLLLKDLLETHRTLNLIIVENPSKAIPKRVLLTQLGGDKKDLDLRVIDKNDIIHLKNWIVLPDRAAWIWDSVLLSWGHPFFCQILNEITIGLHSISGILSRVIFPTKFYLTGKGELDPLRLKELRYFYKKLQEHRLFHTIGIYVAPGLLGNDRTDYMLLTRDNTERMDLVLSSLIWDPIKYDQKTLCLLPRES